MKRNYIYVDTNYWDWLAFDPTLHVTFNGVLICEGEISAPNNDLPFSYVTAASQAMGWVDAYVETDGPPVLRTERYYGKVEIWTEGETLEDL